MNGLVRVVRTSPAAQAKQKAQSIALVHERRERPSPQRVRWFACIRRWVSHTPPSESPRHEVKGQVI